MKLCLGFMCKKRRFDIQKSLRVYCSNACFWKQFTFANLELLFDLKDFKIDVKFPVKRQSCALWSIFHRSTRLSRKKFIEWY